MKKAFYIITIHNKQDLILNVLEGVINSTNNSDYETNIVCVLDGCHDNSESIIDQFSVNLSDKYKLYKIIENDVHELLSINSALKFINTLETSENDLIFFLQDDVVLKEENLNEIIHSLYSQYQELGYISFRCGLLTNLDSNGLLHEHSFIESTDGHWKQLNLDHFVEMKNKEFGFVEIVIKSPTCIKKKVLDHVGIFDEKLAPFGHDDLDLCIRLNNLGYKNAVFGASFTSKLDWGGTREEKNQDKEYHKKYNEIIFRNKLYLTKKHESYYAAKFK
jgi:GT2 family glycosyltransferase